MDSDSSESSESEGWINVDSDGDQNLDISDSEDDKPSKKENAGNTTAANETATSPQAEDAPRVSTLATTKVRLHPQ